MRVRPEATVAGVAVVWGTIGVLVRWIDLPAVAVVWCRVAIGAAGLAAWLRWHADADADAGAEPAPGRDVAAGAAPAGWQVAVTGVLLAGHWVALFGAFQRAPIGTVLLVTYLAPVVVTAAAPRVLGEHAMPVVRLALVGAVVGTALVVGPGGDGARPVGLALAGLAAASFAALILVGKPLAQAFGGLRVALVQQAVAAVVLVPFAATAAWGPPRSSWWWLVVLGLVHTAAGLALYLSALARMPVTAHGVLGYLEPVAAVAVGWLVLEEVPGPTTVAGGALIVAAGIVVVRSGSTVAGATPEVAGALRG